MRAMLGRLAEQTRPADEIIICDDTDIRPSPFCEVADLIPNGVVLPSGAPSGVNGVSIARNQGIQIADGDIMLLLDDDSIPHPRGVEVHEYVHGVLAQEQPGRVFAVLGQRSPEYDHLKRSLPLGAIAPKAPAEARGPLGSGNFITNNLSFSREWFLGLGGFDEDFAQPNEYGWEDIELGVRWFKGGYQMAYTTDALVYHPENPRTPAKEAAARQAWYRLVSKHPEHAMPA